MINARISLTASMRNNLLSLQNISGQVDATQNRLSTGNKVNSAIDNPSSYYTARALNNRANDLNALLDSMGQAVSTIKAATTALETGAEFLEQAAALANQALENMAKPGAAEEVIDLPGYTLVSSVEELKAALADDSIDKIAVTRSLTFDVNDNISVGAGKTLRGVDDTVTLSFETNQKGLTAITLADDAVIRDITVNHVSKYVNEDETGESGEAWHSAVTITGGHLDGVVYVSSSGRGISSVRAHSIDGTVNMSVQGDYSIACVGDDDYGIVEINGTVNTIVDGNKTVPFAVVKVNGELNAILTGSAYSENGFLSDTQINNGAKIKCLPVNRVAFLDISSGAEIWYASSVGSLQQCLISEDISIDYASLGTSLKAYQTGETLNRNDFIAELEAEIYRTKTIALAAEVDSGSVGKQEDLSLSTQFSDILAQYDHLMKDASYKGVNLLQDNNKLLVRFDEHGSSFLNVVGKEMNSKALGLTTTEWQTAADIEQALGEILAAQLELRAFTAELGNNYSIITTRQDFTENLINILTEGADKLTLADMNEESANMLALQTRQQLAVNSLSLASQASQSVLRLF